MTVTGHIPIGMTAYDGVNDGMDQINHIHYVLDMLLPANVDLGKLKWPDRLKMMASLDVNSKQGKKAVAFSEATQYCHRSHHGAHGIPESSRRRTCRQNGAWH